MPVCENFYGVLARHGVQTAWVGAAEMIEIVISVEKVSMDFESRIFLKTIFCILISVFLMNNSYDLKECKKNFILTQSGTRMACYQVFHTDLRWQRCLAIREENDHSGNHQ
jgi:hypothetical protein